MKKIFGLIAEQLRLRKAVKRLYALSQAGPEGTIDPATGRVSITELISGYSALLQLPESYENIVGFGLLTSTRTYWNASDLLPATRALSKSIGAGKFTVKVPEELNRFDPAGTLLEFYTDHGKLIEVGWFLQAAVKCLEALDKTLEEVRLCRADEYDYWYRVCSPFLLDFNVILVAHVVHYRKIRIAKQGEVW